MELIMKTNTIGKCLLLLIVSLGLSCKRPVFIEKDITEPPVRNMDYVDVLSFRDSTDTDLQMIQMAINYAADNGIKKVVIPEGVYLIDATEQNGTRGIVMKDSIHLSLDDNATIKAIPNNAERYYIISIDDVSNVSVTGGTILGERNEHTGTTGEWGMGIYIKSGIDVLIKNVNIKDCWGDGILVGGYSQRVEIDKVLSYNNRRQGMSIVRVDGLIVKNSEFSNTNGTAPEAGIDLEPDLNNQHVKNVLITNCKFSNNNGRGILITGIRGPISLVEIDSCHFAGNFGAISAGHQAADIKISNIEIQNSDFNGISFGAGVKRAEVKNATIRSVTEDGIRCNGVENVVLSNIDVVNGAAWGISVIESEEVNLSDMKIQSGPLAAGGIRLASSKTISVTKNDIQGGKVGLSIGLVTYSSVNNSKISLCTDYGISFWNSSNCLIDSIKIESISKSNVIFNGSNNNQFLNSLFKGGAFVTHNTDQFVLFNGTSTGNLFDRNVIEAGSGSNKAKYGIRFLSTARNNIASNNTFDPASYVSGVYLDESGGTNQVY